MTTGLDTGTYEVLRDRLAAQAGELARRAEALNVHRRAAKGRSSGTLCTGRPVVSFEVPARSYVLMAVSAGGARARREPRVRVTWRWSTRRSVSTATHWTPHG